MVTINTPILALNSKQQEKFFTGLPAAEYAGELVSKVIVKLTRKWTKGVILDVGAGTGALLSA